MLARKVQLVIAQRSASMWAKRAHWRSTFMMCCLLPILMFASHVRAEPAIADSLSDPVATRRMVAFYEVFTGRKLSATERRQIDKEFVAGHARSGKNRQAIRRIAWEFGILMILLREEKDRAAALSLRHQLLEGNYFRPEMQNTLELRLLTEPDPVRVVDVSTRRLMTEKDVIALANIRYFNETAGAPRHRELSRQQIEALVSLLNRSIGANRGKLPQFFPIAGAYWAGIQQLWPYLSSQEKELARAYARSSWRVSMPVEMYAALLGLDRPTASSRWSADVATRIRGREDTIEGVDRLHNALDALFAR